MVLFPNEQESFQHCPSETQTQTMLMLQKILSKDILRGQVVNVRRETGHLKGPVFGYTFDSSHLVAFQSTFCVQQVETDAFWKVGVSLFELVSFLG